jgi:IS30 family transposase
MSYKHLSLEERYYIEIELKEDTSINQISKALGRPQGTISKEIQRNKGKRGYRHKQAHENSLQRCLKKVKVTKLTSELCEKIKHYLIEEQWSPEQMSGRWKRDENIEIHHKTIYRYIYQDKSNGGDLYTHLRHYGKTYRKRNHGLGKHIGIPDRVDIDERPEAVNNRERLGDWEADTIIGKNHKGAVVTLDERVSKLRLAYPLARKKALSVKDAIVRLLSPLKAWTKTITFDNGREFTEHMKTASELACKTYFAKPYHSWERGQNENANGLLRQYFPKAMELNNIAVDRVVVAIDKLNSRPRKCLDWKTPYEVFQELSGFDARIVVQGIR